MTGPTSLFTPLAKAVSCPLAVALLFAAAPAVAEEGNDLTFTGDATFIAPHGGQTIHVALYDVVAGKVLTTQQGQVAANEPPAFSFSFPSALEAGKLYDVHYWIDSNFGGGSEGSCDPVNVDHQWRVALTDITGPVDIQEAHAPGEQAPVCTSFK
ncbi:MULTISPECIES: hypothetical protein [Halomonas]|uniref:Uncharacterized protein n=1 Tax=Halomonas ventosae TaxID=229007 RepID=A0A4R6GS69_9GAMM|nr:hypothetical protein [Halomonas ventosae]TDN98209.1 hypothetical protein DFO68_12817 [Halomonas ventosae]